MSLLAELKRRNVIRMAGLYLVGAWLVVQVASTLLPMFEAPAWAPRAVVIGLVALFLPVMLFSWVYELTPEGLKRESEIDRSASITQSTGQRNEHMMVVMLAAALAYFAFDKFVLAPRQQAVEVAEARRAGGAEALVSAYGDKSIAVLPFVNMSADKEQEYFADGVAEELLNQLAKVQGLRVIARTSSFSFKGKDADVATIGAALKVAHLLEGSVRRSGNKLRISAKLIRTADGGELWSQTYDREMADIFAMQDDIAGAVARELELKLLGQAWASKGTNAEAYAMYLQARQLRQQRSRAAVAQAFPMLQRALELDPVMAEAWTESSLMYRTQSDIGARPNIEGYRLAREAAQKALELNPDEAGAHVQLSALARGDLDVSAAAAHISRAAATDPGNVVVLRGAALVARDLGRLDDAMRYAQAAAPLDPRNAVTYAILGNTLQIAGRVDESLAAFEKAIQLSPNYVTAHDGMTDGLLAKGKPQEALAAAKREEDGLWRQIALAKAYHALGMKAESDAALAKAIRDYPKDGLYNIAYVHAIRGEKDQAFEWLERAVQERDPGLSEIASSTYFGNMRQDPRWLPFLRRIGFAPEQLAAIKLDVPLPASTTGAAP